MLARYIHATRVQVICPCRTYGQFIATNNIIAFLKSRRSVQAWGGFTHSLLDQPSFVGYFWHRPQHPRRGWWEEDQNIIIIIDVPERTPTDVIRFLTQLREHLANCYQEQHENQEAFWITVHELYVLDE